MIPLAALVLLAVAPGSQDETTAEQNSIEGLISDLGASDPQVCEHAEKELKKLGKDAVPALREAARSDNAERAMRARALLVELAHERRGKDGKERPAQGPSPAPRMAVLYEDWTQGIHFALEPGGAVELTVPEKDESSGRREYHTYRAPSMEEFKKKYPQVAQKYDLEKFVTIREVPVGDEQLREWLGLEEPSEGSREEGSKEPESRRFGIVVSPVGPALASHLGLREGEGLVVRDVEAGSLAEKSAVKPYDVIVKLNGETAHVQKIGEFRKSLHDALGTNAFTLELIRGGKRETLRVTPPAADKEERKDKVK
jgi:hypothetical protein